MNPVSSAIRYRLPPRVKEMRLPSDVNRGFVSASLVFVTCRTAPFELSRR